MNIIHDIFHGKVAMKLVKYRRAAGLSQQGLANLARVARASVSHVETRSYPPTPRFAGKICRALSAALGSRVDTWDVFPSCFTRIGENSGGLGKCA